MLQEFFEMENSDQHWLEKVFPPHFSSEDFFSQSCRPDPLICEALASERAKRVEGIYKTVMTKFKEERRSQRQEPPSKLAVTELELGLAETKINISKEETEGDSACWGSADLEVESEGSAVETGGHCIWDARECVALRREMHKEHLGSISLKLQLSFLKEELAGLKAKCKKLVAGFEEAKEELSCSRKETLCKGAQLEQLEKQSTHKDCKIESLERELREKSATVNSLKKELQQAREEILQLGLLKTDLQEELEELKAQQDFRAKISAEKAMLHYEAEKRQLQRELEDARSALAAEKALNAKNSKALEMLKKHFSGPPSSDAAENLRLYFL